MTCSSSPESGVVGVGIAANVADNVGDEKPKKEMLVKPQKNARFQAYHNCTLQQQ